MTVDELAACVEEFAAQPSRWREHVSFTSGHRHYVSLHRDDDVDVWLLCWNTVDDTGWHDHDVSSGAVAVVQGVVRETTPRLGGTPAERHVGAGQSFTFGPDRIHRMTGAIDGSVSIHAYSPPLQNMGQYVEDADGVLRRVAVSYTEELRPSLV
jgi:hypothetical protein